MYWAAVFFAGFPFNIGAAIVMPIMDLFLCMPIYSSTEAEHTHTDEDEVDLSDKATKELQERKIDKRLVV